VVLWRKGDPAYDTMLTFGPPAVSTASLHLFAEQAPPPRTAARSCAARHGFPGGCAARTLTDQYNFGPARWFCPVTTYLARTRPVYLRQPRVAGMISGPAQRGRGKTIEADAPFDDFLSLVRAGSIIPLGPELQYAAESRPTDYPPRLYRQGWRLQSLRRRRPNHAMRKVPSHSFRSSGTKRPARFDWPRKAATRECQPSITSASFWVLPQARALQFRARCRRGSEL